MTDILDEELSLMALNSMLGDRPAIANQIISALGSASAIFDLSLQEVKSIFAKGSPLPYIIARYDFRDDRKLLEEAHHLGIRFISQKSKHFPSLLLECSDAPCGLFTTRDDSLPMHDISITARFSEPIDRSDIKSCRHLVNKLLEENIRPLLYISVGQGLAIQAIEQLKLIPSPMAIIPEDSITSLIDSNRSILELIQYQNPNSFILNDIPLTGSPVPNRQGRSCRVAAGCGCATILFSGGHLSACFRTGMLASSYDRDVFAFPGNIYDTRFHGNNSLIATYDAEIVTSFKWLEHQLKNRPYRCRY